MLITSHNEKKKIQIGETISAIMMWMGMGMGILMSMLSCLVISTIPNPQFMLHKILNINYIHSMICTMDMVLA